MLFKVNRKRSRAEPEIDTRSAMYVFITINEQKFEIQKIGRLNKKKKFNNLCLRNIQFYDVLELS